jgi:hypothetical protein
LLEKGTLVGGGSAIMLMILLCDCLHKQEQEYYYYYNDDGGRELQLINKKKLTFSHKNVFFLGTITRVFLIKKHP